MIYKISDINSTICYIINITYAEVNKNFLTIFLVIKF